jgi:glycosyltransferase involved in cell wall biosynthesis
MSFLMILSIVACFSIFISSVTLFVGLKKMQRLSDVGIGYADKGPLVSVIMPACNEEKNIENSLVSLLAQNYKNLEIIVINDRSTDNTAGVLKRLKVRFPSLIVYTISVLPEGWMGKSHALATGAVLASGEYLLFTDADVIFEETTIARAVEYLKLNQLDHLTLVFKNMTRGWLLNSLILDSGLGLLFMFKPWLVRKSANRHFVGIGAFNLVKRSVYQEIGGHKEIKMHPLDDMMLGKIIKKYGFFQDCLLAYDFIKLPWYDSVNSMINGLEKNMFAVLHYRLWLVPFMLLAVIVPSILPVWGVILGENSVRLICLVTIAIRLMTFYGGLRLQGLPWYYLPGCIISPYISCYILLKSAMVTLKNGGIFWRGQHYALADLKKTPPLLL